MAIGPPLTGIVLNPPMALLALVTIPLIPVVATPMVIGAYLGRLVSPGRVAIPIAPIDAPSAAISSRMFVLFGVGLLACVTSVFFVPQTSSARLIVWIGMAAALAVTAVAWAGSGILKGTSLAIGVIIAAFMTAVIYDTATGGPSHNLLPFEMWYVIVATLLPAASLALLTQWAAGRVRVRPDVA